MDLIKTLHITFAILTVCSFAVRAVLRFTKPDYLSAKSLKIAPHIIDTFIVLTAIVLFHRWGTTFHPWLTAKLAAIAGYIVFGHITLNCSYPKSVSAIGLLFSFILLIYIFMVAISKSIFGVF